jgi:hypothetical protein
VQSPRAPAEDVSATSFGDGEEECCQMDIGVHNAGSIMPGSHNVLFDYGLNNDHELTVLLAQ